MTSVVIIGGGPGGYEAALVAAQLGAQVTLIDASGIGGSAVLILLAICIQLTVSISGLHRQLNQVNESLALLRDKVENDPAR